MMKFKLLSIVLLSTICQQSIAQKRLTTFAVNIRNGSVYTPLDSVTYDYLYPYAGLPVVQKIDWHKNATEDLDLNTDSYIFGNVSFKELNFLTAENHKTNTNMGTVRFYKEIKTYNTVGLLSKLEQYPDTNCMYNMYSPIRKWVTDYTYSGTGKLTSRTVNKYLPSGAVYSALTDTFAYNSSDQMIFASVPTLFKPPTAYFYSGAQLDSVRGFDYSAKYIYSAGKLQTKLFYNSSMVLSQRIDCYYNTAGHIVKDSVSRLGGSGFVPNTLYVFEYNTQQDQTKQKLYDWDAVTASWQSPSVVLNYTYDMNHNVTEYYYDFLGQPSDEKDIFTYNSNNLLVKYTKQQWDAATTSWVTGAVDTERNYYYTDVTNVKNVSQKNLECSMYPMPANNMMNIAFATDMNKAGAIRFECYNLEGRLVKTMVAGRADNGTYTMPVDDLNAGMYFLHIKAGDEQAVKQFAVVH